MSANLNDRVALILGRALLRAEALAVELERANERIAALNEQIVEMGQTKAGNGRGELALGVLPESSTAVGLTPESPPGSIPFFHAHFSGV